MDKLSPKSFQELIDDTEYQKTYLFRIDLPEVDLIDSSGSTPFMKLKPNTQFELCTSATALPSIQTDVKQIPYYNGELKVAQKTKYSNWSATFRLDINKVAAGEGLGGKTKKIFDYFGFNPNIPMNATSTYQYFYNWSRVVYNIKTRVSYLPKTYKKVIDLFLLNELGQDILNFTLYGAFPINISGGSLDYSNDSILTYNVDFAFDSFELKDVGTAQYQSTETAADERAKILKELDAVTASGSVEGVQDERPPEW